MSQSKSFVTTVLVVWRWPALHVLTTTQSVVCGFCWRHGTGPHIGKTKLEKQDYFQRIVRFLEDVKIYRQTDVAVLGGDFNLDTDLARDSIENLRSQLPDIELFEILDEKLMYTVVWPAGYLELRPDFPKIIGLNAPTVSVHDSGLPPFNHPILLYRLRVRSDHR